MNDEDIKKITSALKGSDSDTFAQFTAGLKNNWVFLGAVIMGAMWVFNSFNSNTTINNEQDFQIQALTASIADLSATVDILAAQQQGSAQDTSQIKQDIALIKADISTIKESVK